MKEILIDTYYDEDTGYDWSLSADESENISWIVAIPINWVVVRMQV